MSSIEKTWGIALILLALPGAGCLGPSPLVGSDGAGAGTAGRGGDNSAGAADNSSANSGGAADNSPASSGGAADNSPAGAAATAAGAGNQVKFLDQINLGPGKCLPQLLQAETYCQILTTRTGAACDCSEPGLVPSSSIVTDLVRSYLKTSRQCGSDGQPACSQYCACEYPRAIGTSLIECKTEPESSSESTGWCYVSADASEQQAKLVADCPASQQQKLRFMGNASLLSYTIDESGARDVFDFLACADTAGTPPARALGEVCSVGHVASVNEVTVVNEGFPGCTSGVCVANHFQGLVSCPYGQVAGAGDCFLPGGELPVANAVEPQLVDRQAAVASICSCQCSGSGPGPYCTCPESMQCEHLVDDLHLGSSQAAGSYCIPKGSEYYADQQTACVEPNCGAKHPY